jgi:uncharacterized protein (TIGR02118 family)
MIKFSIFYPNKEGTTFDMDYYCNKHIPLLNLHSGEGIKRIEVEQGLAGGAPGSEPEYIASGHIYFDSMETFQTSFVPHIAIFRADVPNYTNVVPVLQISEIKM